jgi:hypothetical protein
MKTILFILFIFFKLRADTIVFTFPAEKNISKLPSVSMVYDLDSNNSVKLNENRLYLDGIKANLVKVSKVNRIRFTWPKGVLSDGDFIALDSAKKFLFKFKSNDIKLNSKSGLYQSHLDFDTEDFKVLRTIPFFSLCIQKIVTEGTLRICTQEYFVKSLGKTVKLQSRSEIQTNPSVEINGNVAGPQGEILLSAENSINLKFLSTQKSFIELDLVAPKFDILEVTALDSENYKVKARGSLPVNTKVDFIDKNTSTWSTSVPKAAASLYIRSSFGLNYKTGLPKLNSQGAFTAPKVIILSGSSYTTTSSTEIVFKLDEKYSVSLNDSKNQTLNKKNGVWYWKINNPSAGLNNFDIKFSDENEDWTAAIQIEKLKKHHASILIGVPPWLQADYRIDWNDRWASSLQAQKQLTKQATNPLDQQIIIDTKFKFYSSYFMTHPTVAAGLYLSLSNYLYEGSSYNSQVMGLSIDSQLRNNLLLTEALPWFKTILIFPLTNTGDLKIKNSLQLQATLSTSNKVGLNYEFGLKTQIAQYELTDVPSKQISNLVLVGGLSQSF